jgi:deoxyhypusine synthase
VREIIKYLVENKMIDCIVCDELGVEEDMKRSL